MPRYRRILSIVDASEASSDVVARTALLGKNLGATIALATISENSATADQSIQARFASIGNATQRAESLAGKAGLQNAEVLVSERDRHALAAVVASWSPDLLIVGSPAPGGLVGWLDVLRTLQGQGEAVDILMVEPRKTGPRKTGLGRRLAAALSGLF